MFHSSTSTAHFALLVVSLTMTSAALAAASAAAVGPWAGLPTTSSKCKELWHPAECESSNHCRWRQKKGKCVDLCQGRPTWDQCARAGPLCQWVGWQGRDSNSVDDQGSEGRCMRVAESRAIVLPTTDEISVKALTGEDGWVQFHGLEDEDTCHNTNNTVAFSVASAWAGYLVVEVNWGDIETKHGTNVAELSSTGISHVYDQPGTYAITATALVRRLNADRTGWETISKDFATKIEVRDDCEEFQGTVSVTCEPIEFTSGNDGSYMARVCFTSDVTQTLSYVIDWGLGSKIPHTKTFYADETFCRSKLYDEVGRYSLLVTSGGSNDDEDDDSSVKTLVSKGVYVMPTTCGIDYIGSILASQTNKGNGQDSNLTAVARTIVPADANNSSSSWSTTLSIAAVIVSTMMAMLMET